MALPCQAGPYHPCFAIPAMLQNLDEAVAGTQARAISGSVAAKNPHPTAMQQAPLNQYWHTIPYHTIPYHTMPWLVWPGMAHGMACHTMPYKPCFAIPAMPVPYQPCPCPTSHALAMPGQTIPCHTSHALPYQPCFRTWMRLWQAPWPVQLQVMWLPWPLNQQQCSRHLLAYPSSEACCGGSHNATINQQPLTTAATPASGMSCMGNSWQDPKMDPAHLPAQPHPRSGESQPCGRPT